ncbi:sensor histidine kinase [Exiguobacterium chiriqhucha]|uniref:sensor histidine kinase n=1 Tax=Exiguobacterium chiriqhucha TaxID=1385984 RepID=UPI0004981F2C|nr:sensor histidine kinase [Exiguobacterium chiriqhucha]
MKKDSYPRTVVWHQLFSSLLTALFVTIAFLIGDSTSLRDLFTREEGLPFGVSILVIAVLIGSVFGVGSYFYLRRDFREVAIALWKLENQKEITFRPLSPYRDTLERVARISKQRAEMVEMAKRVGDRPVSVEEARSEAVVEERRRVARELHDSVSQQLYAISMMTTAAKQTIEAKPDVAAKQIEQVEVMAQTAQAEMRSLLLQLRPVELEGMTLKTGIERLLEELSRKQSTELIWRLEEVELSRHTENELFRIVQEAISNTLRHAKAKRLEIEMRTVQQTVILKINDDGIGFNVDDTQVASYGLQSIRERTAEVGGTLRLVSVPGVGTQIEVRVKQQVEGLQ